MAETAPAAMAAKRAALTAMAQQGTRAFAVNTAPAADGAPVIATPAAAVNNPAAPALAPPVTTAPPGSKAAAVGAAVARAQQISAPEAFVGQQAAQVGTIFDQAAATRRRNDSITGGLSGAYQRNTGNYLAELEAAKPVLQSRTELAVRQIMAEREADMRRSRLEERQLALSERELGLKEKQFAESLKAVGAGQPLASNQAAKNIGLSGDRLRKVLADPAYDQGRQLVLSALEDGYSYEELDGLLASYQKSGITDPNTGASIPMSFETARLLAETYRPVFTRPGEEAQAEASAADTRSKLGARDEVIRRVFGNVGQQPAKPTTKLEQDAAKYRAILNRGAPGA